MADRGSFSYRAQTNVGQTLSGTLDAAGLEQARGQLQGLGLRVIELAALPGAARPAALRGDDFLAFNQQLAHLTESGLPVEYGLRLIAQDMSSGRLAETVRQVARDMEGGVPLEQAFSRHAAKFPPLYGRLIAAGVKTNKLSAMLFNLGRHLELVARVRATIWRVAAYPLMVMVGLVIVLLFLSRVVLPQFEEIFRDFRTDLPKLTEWVLQAGHAAPYLVIGFVVVGAIFALLWLGLWAGGGDRAVIDAVVLWIPLVGPILRRNIIARWCDALRLGVEAGLDLPQALGLASEAVGSPGIQADTATMVTELRAGRRLEGTRAGRVLPATVWAAIQFGADQHDLPGSLASLTELYRQQAEHRAGMLPAVLTPLLLLLTAGTLGFVIIAMFLPLVRLIQAVSG